MPRLTSFAAAVAAIGFWLPAASAQTAGPIALGNGAVVSPTGVNAFTQRISSDPFLQGAAITAAMQDNTMYMRGTVPTLAAQLRARAIAESMYGLNAFVDETRVQPTSEIADPELQQKVRDEIFAARLADELDIDVSIDDGIVTLAADRLSRRHEQMLVDSIANLVGVRDVKVDIEGRPVRKASQDPTSQRSGNPTGSAGSKSSDTEISLADRVQRSMRSESRVPADAITVDAQEDTVILSGRVNSLAEKRAAVNAAYVQGVQNVSAEDVSIAAYESPQMRSKSERPSQTEASDAISARENTTSETSNRSERNTSPAERERRRQEMVSDDEVLERVKQSVQENPRLRGNDIQFEVNERVVTVGGTVDTMREQQELYNEVRFTRGVKDTLFDVEVAEVENSPEDLKQTVENRLQQVGLEGITVNTARGDVNLEGELSDVGLEKRALDVVRDIPGVRSVMHNFETNDESSDRPYVADPNYDRGGAFSALTQSLTRPGAGSATPFGGGAAVAGATPKEVRTARNANLPDGVDAEGVAKRGRPIASPGANDAPAAEVTTAKPDEEVADGEAPKVRKAISENPRLKHYDITVREVGEGRMVISGAVTDWYEYSLIRRLAYDAGATDVEMTVRVR